MAQEIAIPQPKNLPIQAFTAVSFTKEQLELMKKTIIPKDFTPEEMAFFLNYAQMQDLQPLKREIYAIKYSNGRIAFPTSYHVLLAKVLSNPLCEGFTNPKILWIDDKGNGKEVWLDKKSQPLACKVGVYRKGFKEPQYVYRYFAEAMGMASPIGKGMPMATVEKITVVHCLRQVFDDILHGLYILEENGAIDIPCTVEDTQPMPQTLQPTYPDYPTKEDWDLAQVDNAFLPASLREKNVTYKALATDTGTEWKSKEGKDFVNMRQLVHIWQEKSQDPKLREIASALLAKYPSQKQEEPAEETPPPQVTA